MTLSEAVSEALELKGERLLSNPKVFRSVLSDLMDPESDEMRVICALADAKFLAFFFRAAGSNDQKVLQSAARNAAAYALKACAADESKVLSVAEQIARGVWNHSHPGVSWVGQSSDGIEEDGSKRGVKTKGTSRGETRSSATEKSGQRGSSQGSKPPRRVGGSNGAKATTGGQSKAADNSTHRRRRKDSAASGNQTKTKNKGTGGAAQQVQKQPQASTKSGGKVGKVLCIVVGLFMAFAVLSNAIDAASGIEVTYHLADGKTVEKRVDPDDIISAYDVDYDDQQRDHYKLAGWALSEDGMDVVGRSYQQLASGDSDTLSLYAIWEPDTIEITYFGERGSGEEVTKELTYSDDLTVAMPDDIFSRDFYTLQGWKSGSDIEYQVGQVVPIDDLLSSKHSSSVSLFADYSFDSEAVKSKLTVTPDQEWDSTDGRHICGFVIRNDSSLTLDYSVTFPDGKDTRSYFHAVGPGEERFAWGEVSNYQIDDINETSSEPLGNRISWSEASYSGNTLTINVTNNSDSTVDFFATYVVLANTLSNYSGWTGGTNYYTKKASVDAGATTQVTFDNVIGNEKIPYRVFLW